MTKGKPWPVEDEKQLEDWYNSSTKDMRVLAFSFDGKYSENAIYQKLLDLKIIQKEEEVEKKHASSSSSSTTTTTATSSSISEKLELPSELPSIEETLKTLAAALKALEKQGLSRADILRLRGIIAGAKIYQELLVDYISYRSIEAELLELREKFAELAKKTQGI